MRITLAEVRTRAHDHPHLKADPTYARWVMRRLSLPVTFVIVRWTALGADAVTGLSIAAGLAAAAIALGGTPVAYVGAVLLLQAGNLLDMVDGEVARVRGTAGKRGTYLDLVGHVVQNRALYAVGAATLLQATNFANWAIAVSFAGLALASPFGEQARAQVTGSSAGLAGAHGSSEAAGQRAGLSRPGQLAYWAYRRVAFLWSYPASMNAFCVALLADAARMTDDAGARPLALPAFTAVFLLTLAAKQTANALRILIRSGWPVAS